MTFSCFLPSVLIVRWAQDFYAFREDEIATVQLNTDSILEVDEVSIQGRPMQIPNSSSNHFEPLVVPGPRSTIPGKGDCTAK